MRNVSGQKEFAKKAYVPLSSLPDQFTNEKLPIRLENADRCYNLIGCFEELPIMWPRQDPYSFNTEFRIYSRDRQNETLVAFERVENCLSDSESCDTYPYNLSLLINSSFKSTRRTIIVIGGYYSKAPSTWEANLKDVWLTVEDVNVIILGWAGGNWLMYDNAAVNTRPVARQLTVLLYYLAELNGLDLNDDSFTEKIYIVGHSLGAHIAGFTGQDLGGKVGRITGLDPAGPQFDNLEPKFRLDKTDAKLVDVLHTNSGASIFAKARYGTALASGHIDFYANDGCHQPGCNFDRFGCSHKKAGSIYISLVEHELVMQDRLGDKNKPYYRLHAYASPSFEEFRNGTSLSNSCPITVLDDSFMNWSDLYECSVPIDYISWFDTLKSELERNYKVDLSPNAPNRKYFFYTDTNTDTKGHYLIKIRASKKTTYINPESCDIAFDIEMSNGLDSKYKIQKYKLFDHLDEYKIVVPFMSADSNADNELVKLDVNGFYLDEETKNQTKLRKSLLEIMPSSIKITGIVGSYDHGTKEKKKGDVINFFKNIIAMVQNKLETNQVCDISIDSFTVQPLRKIHRNLVAVYSLDAEGKTLPDIIILNGNEKSPKHDILEKITSKLDGQKFFLDTIIISPYDSSIDLPPSERALTGLNGQVLAAADTSNISATTWLTLTISMCLLASIIALIFSLVTRRINQVDKQPFIQLG